MDALIKKIDNKNLWIGNSKDKGIVILDRKFKVNSSGGVGNSLDIYFIKCNDWSIFKEERSKWSSPNYIHFENFYKNIKENDKLDYKEKIENIFNNFQDKKKDIQFNFLQKIHNDFLIREGYQAREIVKKVSNFRRINHCWYCKDTVDNSIDYECVNCRWIICSCCGACKLGGCK